MAGRTLTPFGMLAKWVLVPVALAAVGFYLLGPRMGNLMPSMGSGAQPDESALGAKAFAAPEIAVDQSPASRYGNGPEVEVTAKQKRNSRRRKRANPVVAVEDTGKQPASDYAAPN